MALVPNLRYATMAFEAGTHVITIPVSVSEPHSIANIRKTHAEIIADVRAIVALRNERFPRDQGRDLALHRLRLHHPGDRAGG